MSKNKDNEFDFEWDDESSFDSSLDNFGGDVDDYTGEEIKDAKNDRSPVIEKIRSVTPSINAAGRAFTAGAGKGIGKAIENDMPSVYQAYQQGTHILSEARIARQEINDKFKPWWNDTKRAIRRLSQQLEGQMPFGLDKKILKLVGEEDDDQQYKQPSKEALRQEQMDSNINQIFELQMQKSMEQQKDTVLNRAYDRRVDAIRHKESAGFLSKIAESAVYQQAFTSSVFTAYLKKDLELKYKQFYATEDILGVMTNHAKAVDLKLEAVIKNTALPEADKVYMSERLANAAKEKLVNSFSDKVSNYFSKMRENVVDKFKELLDFGELIPELFNSQSDILEMMNDEDMKEFGGSGFNQDSIFTKRGMMGLIFGKAGGSFAQRMFRKFTKLLPQETMASIENYFGGGWNGLALLADDIARGRIKSVPSGIRELIRAVAPNLRDTTQTVLNEGWQNRDAGGKITNRFIQVVQDVIPGYLKMQTRYLEILATGKDSGLLEWDYKKHTFRSQKEMYDELNKSILVDREYAELRIRKGAGDTTNLIAHVTAGYRDFGGDERDSMIKALKANTKDIELFKINLAHSEEYYRITGDILKDLEAIATGEDINVIQENELYKIAFKGINNPIPVAGFWLDLLSDRTQTGKIVPNQIAINDLNRYLTEERMNNSGRFARMMESHIKEGHYFMTGAFGAKQDSSGDWNIDEAALFRQQLGAARSRGGDLTKAITDPEKLKAFNELFGQIQYEEKNKKNWVLDVIKGVKEKISKFNITDFADDILKDPFISAYKKMFGDGKNADKEAEEAWKKVVNSIEEAKKFGHEIYDNVTGAVKKAWDDSKVKTVGEALSLLGSKVDKSFNELLRKLEYKEDGETKLKSISDLTDDDWFDWFASIDNIDTVLRVFGGNEAISHIMRSILPNTVQVLLLAVRDNTEVFRKMRTERQKSSGTDIASVTRRTAVISKLAKDAISEKKKDMDANRHSSLWKPGKNNGNIDKAAYTSLVEDAEKEYSVERESLRLDETKLTDPVVDINKTQLDILKNIDIQLGDFYRAFIDVDFRNKALSELRKSEGKLVGDHENFYKGQDEAVSTAYGEQIARWTSLLNDPTMKQWHELAATQLQMLTSGQYDEQYQGRESYEKYSNRNKDAQIEKVRENAVYGIETGFNVDNVELRSGAVLRSDDELLAAFNRLQTISKSKLTWTEFRNEQHALDRRKHYIRELEKYLKKIDDKNSIQAVLISWIIDNKAWLLKNASNYIPDVALFEIIRNTIIYAMDADSISLKKAERNLSLVLVRSPQSTGRRSEDLIIGYIQEFLPLYTKDILTSAAQSTVSEYAHMKNLAEVDVMGSAIEGTGLTGNRNLTKAYGDMYNEAADKISYAEDGDDHYSSSPEYVNDLLLYHTADAALKGVRHASDNSRMGRLAKASEDTTKRDLYSELARVKNLKQNALEYDNINYEVAAGLDKREADARYGILKQMHGPISKAARRQMWQAMNGKGRKNKKKYAKGDSFDAADIIRNYTNKYDEISGITRGRYKDKASNSLIESTLAGKYFNDIADLSRNLIWDDAHHALNIAVLTAEYCDKIDCLLDEIPELDITNHYRQWLDIPSGVRVFTLDISDSEIRKHHPDLSDAYWDVLEDLKTGFSETGVLKDPRRKNSGYICYRHEPEVDKYEGLELFIIGHELGHIVDERGTVYGAGGGDKAHSGRGHYTEKHADIYGIKQYLAGVEGASANIDRILDSMAWAATDDNSVVAGDDWRKAKSNGRDGRWRADVIRRYLRMRKHKGDPLCADLDDKTLQPQFRNNYAKGDNISFSLPIDQYGGYVDQPTEILGGSGIAGEAGGETILPHKFNERFKELIYRCLRDTVGENIARRVLGMLNPSETTEDKLGILLSDNDKVKFASGGSTAAANANVQTDTDTTNKKDEYTRKHPTDTIKNILLNIMESNEAIYRKLGDGLLVVDLASTLDKLKNSNLMNKLKNLKIGERIKSFLFGTDDEHKGLIGNVLGFGKRIAFGAINNAASFGRHLVLSGKVCDVFLKSDIEGQVHGDKKISADELENGTIFSDAKCTKPIYSVADIYPPVYRKKIDENGNTIVEEAITKEEAKPGLVDEQGNPLTYLGGKIGRFLHNIAMKPINAIFSKSALEKISNIGSSITAGIRHGFAGLFGAYCDVYSARDPDKMLVSGTSIKEGRLVRIPKEGDKPKVVPTVFDIDGECWIMVDDPDNPGQRKLGDKVIYDEDIRAGLQHKDGTPIESSKISLAMSKLRRLAGTLGEAALSLTGGALRLGGTVIGGLWKAGGWLWRNGKEAVAKAFTAKNKYIDVCVIRNNEKKIVMHADELKENKATKRYCYIDKDGEYTPVLSAYGISAPVYDMRGSKVGDTDEYDGIPVQIISQDDVDKQAIFDNNGNKLTEWAGRSLVGKIGFGAIGVVKFGWDKLKKIGKGIWKIGKAAVGAIGSILGEGGAAVTSIITNAWNSTIDLFKNTVVSRKDLQEIVGDRLLDIYGLLYKYMPRKKYDPNDKDGDGDVDGSWADYEQKRKERESKREQARLEQWYKDHQNPHMVDNKEGFLSRLKGLLGFGGDKDDDDGSIGDYLLDLFMLKEAGSWVGGKFKKAGKGIGKLFGKLFGRKGAAAAAAVSTATKAAKEPGILAKTWGSIKGLFGNRAANAAAEKELAGIRAKIAAHHAKFMGKAAAGTAGKAAAKTAAKTVGKGLLGRLATMFGTRIAAQAAVATSANAAPVVGQIASAALWALTGIEIAYLLSKDSPKTKNIRAIRSKGYGLNSKYWEAMIDLETDTFDEWVNGNQSGVDRDRLRKFGYKVDFMSLSGDDSSKVDYLSAWYRQRFTPMYQFYLCCMRSVGAEFESSPPKDDAIPDDRYAVFVNEFTKHVDKFCNGPVRILRLDKSSYTSWLTKRRALEQEEGLSSSKYNDANLRDTSVSSMANKYVGKASDHFAYAWNELWHGNVLNAITSVYKGSAAVYANAITKLVDIAFANVQGIADHFVEGITGVKRTSKHEKAWDKLRLELYGLSEGGVRKDEYNRITNIIKEFEIDQVHVIDGEQEVLDEELEELADKLFPARVRSDIKNRLSLTSGFNDDTSKDLHSEAKSFTISWYKRIFVPIFTAYAQVVRTACGDGPGDNINIDDIPEENRLPLLKDFERQSKQFLSRNIDTEILRMSSDGLYTYLIRRSEEDKAELAKDANGLMTEEDLGFTDKLSKNLNQSGKDFSEAWDALKHNFNVTRAISKTIHGIGTGLAGIFKTVGTSIGESISDFLHGSSNKHKWETRFYDYGFVSTEGSSDAFASITNNNISAMVQFENEAGRLLLEDNTSKPADEYFISILLNTGYLNKCCKSLFGANGTDATLETLNSIKRTLSLTSSKYMLFAGPAALPAMGISNIANSLVTGTNNAVNSLATLKKYLTDMLTSEISESKDKEGKANDIKQKISDMFNYIDFWYTFRFKPIFSVFVNAVSPYGVDMTDIDVDDIPNENRKKAYEEYQKLVRVALKKDNIQRWNLSPEGLAVYLKEINKYREDMKDGTLDDKTNPLAAYYKEKEDEYAREVVDTAIASMHGVSAEDKKHVVEALSKASVEIDNELNDVSFMASLSASDALKDLGVQNIFDNTNKVEVTAFGKLMELTTGYNNYDKKGVNSGIFFDDKLGEVFTDFTEDAHKYLYKGASGEDIHNALTKFMNVYLESKAFLDGQTQTVQILDTIMGRKYPAVAAENATYKYFANWFAHRFIPYYTYFVTLVNKANKVDNKEEPDLGKLTPMTRRYVILKLMTAEKKNLIPSRAQALKLTQDDMDKFYKREQALKDATSPGGSTQRASRSQLLKDLEDSNKALAEKIAKERNKTIADSLNNTTDSSSLSTVKAMDGVSAGAKVGDRFVKQKGRSLTEKERREVWDFLVGRMGLTETQAAAVMGNMMQESGLSCDVVNGIGATGICQWLGSRLYGGDGYIGLIPFAKAKGLDPYSLQAQLEYFEWEVTHNKYERKRFDDYVRNVTEDPNNIDKTIAECAVGFRKGFERCGEHEARDSRRVAYSKALYNKFSSDKDIPKYADPYDSNVESMLSNLSVEETSLPPHIKQYGDNTITSTISSDETTGVSGGNSSLPSHIARYGNISATTAKACKTLTANSREKSIGKCAKYVADALQSAGYKFNRQPSAYMYHTNGVLSGMGFECIGRTNSQPQAGDICVINRFNGHPHGHICMFNGQQWISDFRQRTPVPYKVGAPGGLWYYRPSDNTSAGNSGEFITNGESASSSQDSVVNSTYNSIKTNDALLYSNAVDTIRNSLPEESTEQTPVYTYANMTGEGNNENIRTQNAIQNSITTANNGSAPVVAELQLISSILAGFRGDVNSFINTLLQGIPTQSSKGTTSPTVNKKGELVNNIDEKAIKDMGDKLLAYVTSALSTVMNTKIPNNVNNTSRALASAYPLNSFKRG